METIIDRPLAMFFFSLVLTIAASEIGVQLVTRLRLNVGDLVQFGIIQTATLTLVALVIGFTFAMAVSRYDQRKNLEEEEANAIGTAYLRAGLLPEADAAKVRARLKDYLGQRIAWYSRTDHRHLSAIDAATARTQGELWEAVRVPVAVQQTPVTALVAAGMNDAINSQGYTQAAWWNRIPTAGWMLMLVLAFCANVLLGMGAKAREQHGLVFVLPVVLALAFLLIADIDGPRGGLIDVGPRNLVSLAQSLGVP